MNRQAIAAVLGSKLADIPGIPAARADETNPTHDLVSTSGKRGQIFSAPTLNGKFVGNSQSGPLICLQGYLLRKHYVARDQASGGNKTKAHDRLAGVVKLEDISSGTTEDAIALPALTADDFEGLRCVELRLLFGGKPFAQQCYAACFPYILDAFDPLAQGLYLARTFSQRTPKVARRRNQQLREQVTSRQQAADKTRFLRPLGRMTVSP